MNLNAMKRVATTPFIATLQTLTDVHGDVTASNVIEGTCYVTKSNKLVMDMEGKEKLSGMQLYVFRSDLLELPLGTNISCLDVVNAKIIKRDNFYLPNSVQGMAVIYLP